jgi:hypothetical protein
MNRTVYIARNTDQCSIVLCNVERESFTDAIAYHNENANENDSHAGEANRVTAKKRKGNFLRAEHFKL